MTARTAFEPLPVNVRLEISALWTSMLFVFAYVDLFSLYRPNVRADIEAGTMSGFTISEVFLLAITAYVVVPALMVLLTLVLPARLDRIANLVLAAVYAVTSVGGAFGERGYYLLGTALEVLLLAGVVYYAWTWPTAAPTSAADRAAEAGSTPTARVRPGHGRGGTRESLGRPGAGLAFIILPTVLLFARHRRPSEPAAPPPDAGPGGFDLEVEGTRAARIGTVGAGPETQRACLLAAEKGAMCLTVSALDTLPRNSSTRCCPVWSRSSRSRAGWR